MARRLRKIKKAVITILAAGSIAGALAIPIAPEPLELQDYITLVSAYQKEVASGLTLSDVQGNDGFIKKMNERIKGKDTEVDKVILKMEGGRVIDKILK